LAFKKTIAQDAQLFLRPPFPTRRENSLYKVKKKAIMARDRMGMSVSL